MISDLKFAAYYLPVFCFVNFSLEFFHRHIFIAGRLISYRMESRYDFFYHLNDVRTVFVTCLCQFCQLSEEFTDIKRNCLPIWIRSLSVFFIPSSAISFSS